MENTALGTEFARIFCAGIGPLQLGVVLVYLLFKQSTPEVVYIDQKYHCSYKELQYPLCFEIILITQNLFFTAIEFVGPKYRQTFSVCLSEAWVMGGFVLAGVAYGFRDYRDLGLALGTPTVLLISYFW